MISKRLLTIASLVNNDAIVADIGSDHALLPIYLIKEGIAKKAYAIDNKEGPLSGAIANINEYQFNELIETRLQSGITQLPSDVDTIIIAGMGYTTISEIISDDLEIAQDQKEIIIQCNNHLSEMRRFLHQYQFKTLEERFINLNDQDYLIMKVKHQKEKFDVESYYYSKYLVEQKDFEYFGYIKRRYKHLDELKKYNQEFNQEYEELKRILKD